MQWKRGGGKRQKLFEIGRDRDRDIEKHKHCIGILFIRPIILLRDLNLHSLVKITARLNSSIISSQLM